jgi:hypothetical protein
MDTQSPFFSPSPLWTQVDIGGVWQISYFIGVALILVGWLRHLKPREALPLPAKLLWGYVLLSALFIIEWPAPHFMQYTAAYSRTAAQAFIEVLFIPVGAILFNQQIKRLIPWAVALSLACVWFHWTGLLRAPSFHSSFAALAVPFLPMWMWPVVGITALTHHGSTALMIMAVQGAVIGWSYRHVKWVKPGMAVLLLACGAAAWIHSGAMFDGGERLMKWRQFMTFWAQEKKWWVLGVGPGSFMWTSLMLDKFKPNDLFLQMHNDWLQIVFENGLVGLGLVLWTLLAAVKRVWGNPWLLASLAGLAVFGLTYYPLRFAPTALLTAWIMVRCLSYRKG